MITFIEMTLWIAACFAFRSWGYYAGHIDGMKDALKIHKAADELSKKIKEFDKS